jgi:predicted nucleic acid-binding protein
VILFCDTSALMKLLVHEEQTDQLLQISSKAEAIGVSGSVGQKRWPLWRAARGKTR